MTKPRENSRSTPKSHTGFGRVFSVGPRKADTRPEQARRVSTIRTPRTTGNSFSTSTFDKLRQLFRGPSKANREREKSKAGVQKVVSPSPRSASFPPVVDATSTKPSDPSHATGEEAAPPNADALSAVVITNLESALERERQQVQTLTNEMKELRRVHAKELGEAKSAVVKQVRAPVEVGAADIPIDTFASTLDRVSEAQIKQAVDALNGQIADVIMNALDAAENVPPTTDSADIATIPADDQKNPLLLAAAKLGADDDNRALLVEGALNGVLVQQLHDVFFASQVALSVPDSIEDQRILDRFYQDILRTENYKVAQRWKSVTSAVAIASFDVVAWQRRAEESAARILVLLSAGLSRPSRSLEPARNELRDGVLRLYRDAHDLALIVRRDYLSARMEVSVVAPNQTLESSLAASQWDDIPSKKSDRVLTTYAFGLEKTDEHGWRTSLLVPKVVTEAILRHALPPVAH